MTLQKLFEDWVNGRGRVEALLAALVELHEPAEPRAEATAPEGDWLAECEDGWMGYLLHGSQYTRIDDWAQTYTDRLIAAAHEAQYVEPLRELLAAANAKLAEAEHERDGALAHAAEVEASTFEKYVNMLKGRISQSHTS